MLILLLAVILTWHDPNIPQCDGFFVMLEDSVVSYVTATEFEHADVWGYREYYIRAWREDLASSPSDTARILNIDFSDNAEVCTQYDFRLGNGLISILLPSAPWTFDCVSFDSVRCHTWLDAQSDGRVSVSDLTIHADTLVKDLSLFSMFGGIYHKRGRHEYR